MKIDWKHIAVLLRKWVLNKYVITLVVFLFMLAFLGENSWIQQIKNARQISGLEEELDNYLQEAARYRLDIQTLQGSEENLERYAREHYYMHAPNEDVYLVDEE